MASNTARVDPTLPKDSAGQPVQVLGFKPGQGVPSGNHNLGEAAANGGTQLMVVLGDGKGGQIFRLSFYDATSGATLATGTAENVIIRPGISAADATIATFGETTITDYVHPASVYPSYDLPLLPGQTHVSIATITGGTKAIRVFAKRLD